MKSVMSHQFNQIPRADIPRSVFNRSHCHKTTFDSGYLVPIFCDEVLPGDTFKLKASLFARLTTPIYPIMDNLFLETFFFYVPNRLLWTNFKKFMGEQANPNDSTAYTVPTVPTVAGGHLVGSLFDYFGIPTQIHPLSVNALFSRAYNLIWNEWFRDQNLQNSAVVDTDDGPDLASDYVLRRRNKKHDYFTGCLPWPQKGAAISIPLGSSAPIDGLGFANAIATNPTSQTIRETGASSTSTWNGVGAWNGSTLVAKATTTSSATAYPDITADLSSATAATVNQLREAFQLQRLLERDARAGTRYTEIIQAHFGVTSPDARQQRPEYLGGSSCRINVNTVAQTSVGNTTYTTPLGTLAGYGIAADQFPGFSKSFTEHGVIIGLANVRADLTYQQGLDRKFTRSTKYDYYWPGLANLGEQAVLNREIYAQGTADDLLVFGYQERWSEYRHFPSKITGKFRSTFATPLDAWHLSQKFTSLPALNSSFIEDKPPIARVSAVPSQPQIIFDSFFELNCARPMPTYSVPGLIDHF